MSDNSTHDPLLEEALHRYGLKQRVASIHAEFKKDAVKKPALLRRIFHTSLRIAAALLLVVGIGAIFQYMTLTPGKLYRGIYTPYTPLETRSAVNASPVAGAYHKGQMAEVISLFEGAASHTGEDYFLAGNAYLKSGNAQAAITTFLALLDANRHAKNRVYNEDAEYYLALSYLANGEVHHARSLFQKIDADKNHAYNDEVDYWLLLKLRLLD